VHESSSHREPGRSRYLRLRGALAAGLLLSLILAAVALAAKQPSPKPGSYAGTSSEKSPVTFKVSKSGTSIESFKTALGYNGKCGQGGGPPYEIAASTIAIKHGRFSIAKTFKGPVASIPPKKGKITGRFSGNTVSGTASVNLNSEFHGCSAYSETFTATWKHS
jgi:hypothetical protein